MTSITGLVVNIRRRARWGDQFCPSGRCYILDPADICDASGPHCLPIRNLRRPLLPCDSRNPDCPRGGIYVNPDISCHPYDDECGEGGVFVVPSVCQELKDCPLGIEIADWLLLSGGAFNVTLSLTSWKRPGIEGSNRPGVIINPSNICPESIPGCEKGSLVIFDPVREGCRVGEPMCIGIDRLKNCAKLQLPDNLCASGHCIVCPLFPAHPNDPSSSGVVVCLCLESQSSANNPQVPPIPCRPGIRGCYGKLGRLPSVIIKCIPGLPGCSKDGFQVVPDPDPIILPGTKPIPPGHSLLVPDLDGES